MTFDLIQCLLNQPIRIERILHTLEFLGRGPCGRLSRHKIPATVIVGFNGEVFGHPNLYVADGSVVPANLGVNPSLTIATLAEYIMSQVPAK